MEVSSAASNAAESNSSTPPAAKRMRQEKIETIQELCQKHAWDQVRDRVQSNPNEAKQPFHVNEATPLALACRFGAPGDCVRALLEALPENVHRVLQTRGTPLHEAIVCEEASPEVIQLLLQADEKLPIVDDHNRAALMQDVDGHTPLHLLIRRRTPGHITLEDNSQWMEFLEMLTKSCPQAAGIPDRGEYEEPPLVMALKANQYAAGDYDSDDVIYPRIEMRIHEMVHTMLKYYPVAASQVLEGARGQYTALHSAVFHGRCAATIELLLQAEEATSAQPKAALLANTQGELPLHFAAMRGEPPRSIKVLGDAAPMAVLKRDASGLTPLHWLWIRFVSTVLSLDDRQLTGAVELEVSEPGHVTVHGKYSQFWELERGDFYVDINRIRKLDPPLDFLRMRHIPPELYDTAGSNLTWSQRSVEVLAAMREREIELEEPREADGVVEWTREEAVSCLFWVKSVSLLRAFWKTQGHEANREFRLVEAAMSSPCCPPPIAHIASMLFPEELVIADPDGLYPLHHAAKRAWHSFDWRNDDETETAAVKLLRGESLRLLKQAIRVSPNQVARTVDNNGRLPLHYAIDTFMSACSRSRIVAGRFDVVHSMLDVLRDLILLYPESLERRDSQTMLYPFLQATAAATQHRNDSVPIPDSLNISIVYMLLRENPLLLSSASTPSIS